MHVVSPERYAKKQPDRPRPQGRRYVWWMICLVFIAGLINYFRPLPQPTYSIHVPALPSAVQANLAWPSDGQAAIAAPGYGLLGTIGAQKPLATASIAKVITALCVLQKLPLQPDQTGPTYAIDAKDVNIYNEYANQNGSVLPVEAGESLSEYQALQALMIPSANNIADSLVRWVFGSQSAYADYATSYLRTHGLDQTTIGSDASGYDSSTTSTASDLAQLGLLALRQPTLLQITSQPSATFPIAGTVDNYDTILGQNGIIGLKTGNNDADPGAFLFAAKHTIGAEDIYVTGAIMGAGDLATALSEASQLSASMRQNFQHVTVATKDQAAGSVHTAWGQQATIRYKRSVTLTRWSATPITENHGPIAVYGGQAIGTVKATAGHTSASSTLYLDRPITHPDFWWRLTRR